MNRVSGRGTNVRVLQTERVIRFPDRVYHEPDRTIQQGQVLFDFT